MKNTLFIILLFLNAVGYSQTLPSLPAGSKPYGNQLYLDANGNIIGGTGSAKFRVIAEKKQVDSVDALKADALKTAQETTISGLRTLTGTLKTNYYRTTDTGKQGSWFYDPSDLSSADNTGTIVVSSDGKRFKRIYSNSLNVSWFGAIGDGVTDDSQNINKTFLAAKSGESVEFEKEKTYLTGSQINVKSSVRIIGNNATIKATTALTATTGAVINMSNIKASQSGLTLSVTKNTNSFTLPDGMTAKKGDLILVKGPDIYYAFTPENASFNYKKGQFAVVSSVSGQNVTLASDWFDSFNVTSVAVYEGFNNASIQGLYIDLTEQANSQNQFVGINAAGSNINIAGCTFTGNQYSLIGVLIEGETNEITNCNFYNFFNSQGFSNGGRLGYGVQSNSNNITVSNNFFYDCKHAFTTGPREFVVRGVEISNNSFYENPNRTYTANGVNPLTDYSGTIDAHAGVSGNVNITGNIVYSHGRAVFIRNGNAIISKNSFYQMTNPIGLLATEERPPESIVFENNQVELLDISTSSVWSNYESLQSTPGTVKNISIKSNNVKNGSLVGVYSLKFDIENLTVKDNIINNAIYGVFIFGNNTSRSVSNTLIDHNTINLRSGNGVDFGIGFTNSVADTRNISFQNTKILNNTVNSSLNTGQGYSLIMNNAYFGNSIISNNTFTRGVGQTWSGRNVQFQSGSYVDFNLNNNIFDTAITFQSGTSTDYVLENASISNNRQGYLIQFSESSTSAKLLFNKLLIYGNSLTASNSDPLISFVNQPGSTSWASSKQVLIQNNYLFNTSFSNAVNISASSTGHKIVVIDNVMSARVNDQSSTFYGPIRNKVINGVQVWKGGTTALETGEIVHTDIPTTGAWVKGDKVYNSNVSNNGNLGWVCISSGTPGSWVNISLDSSAYIRNQVSQQSGDFNISGGGRVGNNFVAGGSLNAGTAVNINSTGSLTQSNYINFTGSRASIGWDGSKSAVAIKSADTTKSILFSGGTTDYAVLTSRLFKPAADNYSTLGDGATFWKNIYTRGLQMPLTGILKGNGLASQVSVAVAGTDYLTPANLSSYVKQSGNAFGTTMTIGTTDVNDFNLIRNSVVNFEVTSAGPNFPLGVRSSGTSGAAFSGTSTTGPAAYFNNSSTGSGATLVVNNQSTGLLATFSKSGSTKVTISNEGNVSATGVYTGYGLSLPQRGVSADYTLTDLDYSVMVVGSSSTINIYLPVTPSGRIFIIKRILGGTGPVIISSPGSVIDNVSTKTLSTDNSGVVVQSAGAGQYYVIGTI